MGEKSVYTKKKTIRCWSCHTVISVIDSELVKEEQTKCPHCQALYPEKPINEAKLAILQEKYLATRDIRVLNQMMMYMQDMAYNLICSKLKSSGKFLEEEVIWDKVQWVLMTMTRHYKKPYFKISSFTSYLSQVVLYPLYNYKDKKKDKSEISINTPIHTDLKDNKEQTILDKFSSQPILEGTFEVENFLFREEIKENLVSTVQDFIKTAVTTAYKKRGFSDAIKNMILFNHYISMRMNEKKFANGWWKVEGFDFRDSFEKSLGLLREVIYESQES